MNRSTDSLKIKQASRGAIRIRSVNIVLVILTVVIAALLFGTYRSLGTLAAQPEAGGASGAALRGLLLRQEVLTLLLVLVVVCAVLAVIFLILAPLRKYTAAIRANRLLTMHGAHELRYLAEAYNLMYEENRKHNESLRYLVEHDHLTGLLNRSAFDKLRREKQHDSIALLMIDVDKFKEINDGYGHDTGDRVLQKVAYQLGQSFRASDYPCRIGGDEFAVIMTDMNPSLQNAVQTKVDIVGAHLRDTEDGLPPVTLSVGVAFSRQCGPEDDIFKLADSALYRVKTGGRGSLAFYDPALDRKAAEV